MLIYEYMPNKSLNFFLFGEKFLHTYIIKHNIIATFIIHTAIASITRGQQILTIRKFFNRYNKK
ncbi:hypothetical protein PHJA_001062600 [Phtheirospermum japonicum]|uniref:Uncharacterized protein n=1 Tax=Phtheirospermum japonicum TaxID=374723 RepID=A0A830BT20_9LAMI|nr:hypothetical protein PHJA_001062600 [Phtheirospermum japonicum]